MHAHVAWHHYMARDFDEALTQAQRVVRVEPSFHWGHFFAGWALERLGRGAEAIAALRESVRCSSSSPVMLAGLGHALAVAGDRAAALAIVDRLAARALFDYELALIHVALGERDAAFASLERACAARSGWMVYARVDPRMSSLRADPRFPAVTAMSL